MQTAGGTLLQKKLNGYLAFLESGEILESYPAAKNRPIVFKVVFQFPPDEPGRTFVAQVKPIIESAALFFRMKCSLVRTSTEPHRCAKRTAALRSAKISPEHQQPMALSIELGLNGLQVEGVRQSLANHWHRVLGGPGTPGSPSIQGIALKYV